MFVLTGENVCYKFAYEVGFVLRVCYGYSDLNFGERYVFESKLLYGFINIYRLGHYRLVG